MTAKMGENIQREWDDEPLAVELWEALQLRERDHAAAIAVLAKLAEKGSALAMMYLGHDHVRSGDRDRMGQGENWLTRSARAGSIEGCLQLALHYERQSAWAKAIVELERLGKQGYSPANYYLANLRYRGDPAHRSIPDAIAHLKIAIDAGHLPSTGLLSQIYRKEKFGLSARIGAHWLCLAKIPALARCIWTNPSSDRLRPFGSGRLALSNGA